MPHCCAKQFLSNGSRNRYTKYAHSSGIFLLLLLLSSSAAQVLSEESDELPFICPQGPDKAKCTCTQIEVNCTEAGLLTVPIGLSTNIQYLVLRKNFLSSIDSITSQLPPPLVYIDASFNSITSVDWSSFSSLTNLEELYLQMNLISRVDLSFFYGSKLRVFNVSGNQLILTLEEGLELPLEELYIENCGLNYFVFGASASFCKLKVLHVGGNSFSSLPDNALSCMTNLKEIKLNNVGLTSLSKDTFSYNTQIQIIDLSNNLLTTLPATIFDGLGRLRVLNLAGNSWSCDCSLIWLQVFMESVLAKGGTIVNKDVTYCSSETSLSNTRTVLAHYPFSWCEDKEIARRTKRALVSRILPLNWAATCALWQSSLLGLICGPNQAASCVYDFPSHRYSVVQFSGEINGVVSKKSCRDTCQENNNSYFAYDSSSSSCLCGDVLSIAGCTDCSVSVTTSLSLCNGRYSNIGGAVSVVFDLNISISPTVPQVMSVVNFTLHGGASSYDTFFWNFGDGTTRSVLSDKSALHTYIYAGQFEVIVSLTSSSSPSIFPTQIVLQVTVVSTLDTGKLVCPSVVRASESLNVNAVFTSAWNQKVTWTREGQSLGGQGNLTEYGKECEPLWSQFRGRCIKVFMSASSMVAAHSACITQGARLLRFYSTEEIAELKSSSQIFQSGAGTLYYTGAEWVSSVGRYTWKNTSNKAYVFRETLPNAAQGNCVALTNSGLQGVACSEQLPSICEKDPVTCIGSQQSDGQTCYVVLTSPASWDQAQFACQSTYTNGKLASILDSSHNAYVSGLLTSRAWIGLRAWTALGHYTWQDGQALDGYTKWVDKAGFEPCVSINSSGIWQPQVCDTQNSYICEYFVGDEVKIPWLVAGFVPILNDIMSPVTATEVTPPQTVTSSFVTLLLASWFSAAGQILRWNVQAESLVKDASLTLQIWRPFCITGNLVRPGCSSNKSPLFTCANSQNNCSINGACLDGEYLCMLTNTCLPIAKPCTCTSVSSIKTIDCQNMVISSRTFKLRLIYRTTIRVPATTTQVQFEPTTEVMVQEGDIIGFQSENKDVVLCEESTTSEWRQSVLSASTDYWMGIGDNVDPQAYQLKQDIVCKINAVYVTKKVMLSPGALNYVTGAGVYNFTLVTNSSSSQTCSVTAMDNVRDLLWVYPEAKVQISSVQGPHVLNVNVEAGLPQVLTVKVLQGSAASVTWFLNGGSGLLTALSFSCSASITPLPEICQFHSSILEFPYSSLSQTFPSGPSLTYVVVNVTNNISWEALRVNINAYAPITEVEFYHDDCLNHTACEVTVEAGKAQEFHMKVKTGDMTMAEFYENGTVISPTPSDLSVLPRIFQKSATYILSVNVSNPLSWLTVNLTVHAQIRANFSNFSFDKVLDKVAAGTRGSFSASVKATMGAQIGVTWSFSGDSFQSYMQVNTTVLSLTYIYRFNTVGNVTVTLVLSDTFGDSLSHSTAVEVYKNIDVPLVLNTSSRFVPTMQDFSLSIRVNNGSLSDRDNYGILIFTVNWGDGSQDMTWRNSSPVQEPQHGYKTAGSFTVLVTVQSLYNSSSMQMETITIEAQDVITGLNLTYDGPKHFTENITFTAAQQSGSHVEYSLDFGDNITVTTFQTSPVFIYEYSAADVYRAVVTAKNAVSERTYRLVLYVYDENLLQIIRINAKYCVPVGKVVEIRAEVAAESPNSLYYEWNFGNNLMSSGHPMKYATSSYNFIGIYYISLKVRKQISSPLSDTYRKEICVEEEISGLSVLYDTPVALKQPGALVHALFHASVVNGSNITYTWTVDSGRDIVQYATLNLTVTEARVYNVTVKVENNLNYQVQTMELAAIEIITGSQIHCNSCSALVYAKTHANTTLEASTLYGTLVNYTWNFDDSLVSKTGKLVQHNFLTPRAYLVKLLAENSVSNESVVVSIMAQDEVSGVGIKTSPFIVEVNANITFQVTLSSGTNVTILWKFDSLNAMGSNSASFIHAFASAGYHQCSVVVSNAVSSVTKSSQLAVLEQITGLSINQSLKSKPGSLNWFATTGLEYRFTPNIDTDFLVDYEWRALYAGLSLITVGNHTFKFIFSFNGTYQINLKAKNAISLQSVVITVEAQEQISKVYIDSNKTSHVQVLIGEAVLFHAVAGTGSHLTYLWTLSGLTQLSKSDTLILPFLTAGNFTVQVAVTNDLDTVTAAIQVFVYISVSNVAIKIKQSLNLPFVNRGTNLDFYSQTVSGTALVYSWTITHLLSDRKFTSDLVSVSFSFNLTGTYEVFLKVKNSLSSEEDQLTLVVQSAITELRVTLQDSVVATGSSLTFTAEVNLDATDVNYVWQVDGEIKQSSTFTRLFPVAGVYKVLITAANNVSSMNKENVVRVQDPISNLQILDCQMVRLAQVSTSIRALADSGTNITYTWLIEISKQNKTFAGQNMSISFPSEGSYSIILSAYNEISTKTTSCQLQSQLPVNHVTLAVSDPSPGYIFQNQNVTFTAVGKNFGFAIFEWRIANYSTFISKSNTYTTSIPAPGNYTLTLIVSNVVSRATEFLDFTVKAFLCQLPDVSRVGAFSQYIQRSRPLEFEVAIDAKGCTSYIAVHKWTVVRGSGCTEDEDTGQKVDIGNTVISSPSVVIGPRILDVGFYCIHFVTGYQYTSVSLSVFYTVNVTASRLKALIKGGNRRTVAIGSRLHFDGTLSFDPDNSSESALTYNWKCVEVNVKGGCFSHSSDGTFWHQGFKAGEYTVILQVDAPGRTGDTAEQIIEVLNIIDFVPTASVVCESCLKLGSFRISCSHHVVLSAACENCQCEPAFSWKIFEGLTEIFPSSSQTSTGLSKEHLVLNKWGILKDGFNYTFIVLVSCINSTTTYGKASLILLANFPPSGGSCSFFPTEIIPLENQVTVNCSGWIDRDDPDTLISYRIYVSTQDPLTGLNQTYMLYSGTDEIQSVYLSSFTGKSVHLRVMVGDEFGAMALGGQSVIRFKNVTLPGSMTKTDYLMMQTDTVFSALTKQASPVSLLQYAIALGQQLNVESHKEHVAQTNGKGTQPEQTRAAVRDAVTICLSTAVPVTTLEDVQQMTFALRLLTDYSSEYLTEDSQRLLANNLQVIDKVLQQKVSNGLDRDDVPLDDLLSVIRNLLNAVNARIYSLENVWEFGRSITIDNFNTSFRDLRPEIAVIVGDMEFTDISLNETHRKSVVSTTVPLLERVLVSTLQTMIVDEEDLELDIDGIKIKASRSYVKDIELQYTSETAQISIPSTILSGKNILEEVLQVMISHERNPYTYGYRIASWARVPVQTISFYETNGSYIQVADLADDARVGLCMFSSAVNSSTCKGKDMVNEGGVNPWMNLNYKRVTLGPHKSKVWQVPGMSSDPGFGVGVHVQLHFSILSTETNSSNTSVTTVTAYLGINFIPTSNHHIQKLTLTPDLKDKGVDHRKYTFFQNNLNPSDKLHIVATNDNGQLEVELLVGVYFSSCEYFNTASQVWAYNGCQAQEESTAVTTSCKCNHLTSFGGAGIVSVVDIDFSDLENLDLLTNPVVFIVVAIIFGIYILVASLCRYLDNQDLRRISKIPLCGQVGSFLYEVTVVTGCYYNAGTSAHVGIKLYGSPDKGGARHLTKSGAFQRNCRDIFLIANNTNLGEITKVLVWHDNTGLSPSWYLSHILVKDLQTEAKFTFLVNSWLSLEMDNGVIQKMVKASDEIELKKFYSQFSSIFHGLMADAHTWISVSNKSDHSRFTCVQRATCCLTCVYLYMSINAMWYGFFKDRTTVNAPLSWKSFGWEEIVIALASTLMVVPFLFGLALIFKKSRCKTSMFQEALRPGTAQTLEIDAVCTISADGGSYRTATPLGDWIPTLDRESTTDSISQVPNGLKRTVPMHKNRRKGSSDSNGKERTSIVGSGSRKTFWNKESIMKSWPDKVPHWLSKAKAQTAPGSAGPSKTNVFVASAEDHPATSKQNIQPVRNFHSSKSPEDSDEELQKKLDQAEADIARDEEKRKKKMALKLRQASGDGLFDSDDEWVNEGSEDVAAESKVASFNPRKEAELIPSLGRRPSRTNFTLPNTVSHKTDSTGGSKRGSSSLLQDGARPSIVSSSSKTKTTLSGRLRSLSVVSQMSLQRNSGCTLPSWCVYVAYTVCFALCLLSVILVLLYGYNFGADIAIKWVVSLCFTLFISILVVEPLKVLLLSAYMTTRAGGIGEDNSDMIDIKPKIESSEQIKDVKFKPLGGFALLQAKEEGKKQQRLHVMIRQVLMFTFMFALFLAIIYINYSSDIMYRTTSHIHSKFYGSLDNSAGSTQSLNITNLRSIPEFWQWTQTVLARSLHYRELFQTENFGYLMGPAWLRQIRGEIVTCPAAKNTGLLAMPELVTKCMDSGTSDPDTDSYAIGWTSGSVNWTYFSSSQLNRFAKFGQSLMYLGGGYVQELGLTHNDTVTKLQQLEADGWVDLLTRAVFVEFTLYSPSKDLTSCVTLVLEFPISGGILASSSVWTEHLLRFIPGHVEPLMVCQIMVFPFILYFTIMVISALRTQKLIFLTHLWSWLDLFTCILMWTNTGLYITCVIMATDQVKAYLADLTTPAQLERVSLLHGVLRDVHACLVFLFSLKIVRQVRFFRPLYKFYNTLSTAGTPLMGVFLMFIILLLTYAQFGYLIYGSVIYGYHSFQNSFMSLFGLMGSHTNFWPIFECRRVITHLFFISFGIFVSGLVIALSVAVLTWSFKMSRAQMTYKTSLEAKDYEMIEFMIKRFKVITGIQKQKPAFRHVKFEGLPSLPSRTTSSNVSHRLRNIPVPSSSESGHMDAAEKYLEHCMENLQPTWDRVVKAVQKIEDMDKQDEEKLEELLNRIMKPSSKVTRLKLSTTRPVKGKPPLDLKLVFPKFKSHDGRKDVIILPPATSTSDRPLAAYNRRSLGNGKVRNDHKPSTSGFQPKKRSLLSSHQVSPSQSINSSAAPKGNTAPGFQNASNSGLASSKCSESRSASDRGMYCSTNKQTQALKGDSQDSVV